MVKVEMKYNPYLLKTEIWFNGNAPRINSRVEKYLNRPLREWVNEIPEIFYDEMNGYDFDLDFSGTEMDFNQLKCVFQNAGVSDKSVRLNLKNTLNNRTDKIEKLEGVLKTLQFSTNEIFNWDNFNRDNRELIEEKYPLKLINGRMLETPDIPEDIVIEHIDDLEELETTRLSDTPIVINITTSNYNQITKFIMQLEKRDDVDETQMFFLIDESIDQDSQNRLKRTIADIGIKNPQIVLKVFDPSVKCYMQLYPYSNYIKEMLDVLRQEVEILSKDQEKRKDEVFSSNKEIQIKIDELDEDICELKSVNEQFENRDNIVIPQACEKKKKAMLVFVNEWNKKTTKINSEEYALLFSGNFEKDVKRQYAKFINEIEIVFDQTKSELRSRYESWYWKLDCRDSFRPVITDDRKIQADMVPSFSESLMEMKEKKYVQAKGNVIGKILNSSEDKSEIVCEEAYYLQKWRDYVYGLIEELAEKALSDYYENLLDYEKKLASAYSEHLGECIVMETDRKKEVSQQLSDDARKIRNQSDWLENIKDMLRHIERD